MSHDAAPLVYKLNENFFNEVDRNGFYWPNFWKNLARDGDAKNIKFIKSNSWEPENGYVVLKPKGPLDKNLFIKHGWGDGNNFSFELYLRYVDVFIDKEYLKELQKEIVI